VQPNSDMLQMSLDMAIANSFLLSTIAFLALVVIGMFATWKGRKLQIFSREYMSKSKLLRFAPFRLAMYLAVGLTWHASRFRLPAIEFLLTYSMDNRLGIALRAAYWKARLKHMGKNVRIDVGARFSNSHNISIGDGAWIDAYVLLIAWKDGGRGYVGHLKVRSNPNFKFNGGELIIGKGCHIAPHVLIQAIGGVYIGDFTGIASGSRVYSLSHHYKGPEDRKVVYKFTPQAPPEEQSFIEGPVVFEGNNALGLNSVVLPGVTIGRNSWIGVCSYVIEDVPPNCIASGTPCKIMKNRFA